MDRSINTNISTIRHQQVGHNLHKSDLCSDPFEQFEQWLAQALVANLINPNAMTLATASKDGIPSARMVLLRSFDARGLVFYTNYQSQKGQELAENPHAAGVFYWATLARQIRVRGRVRKIAAEESDKYFKSRPALSQLGAWASQQSQVISSRAALQAKFKEFEAKFQGQDISRPRNWGGYRLTPNLFEFWQSRPNRLHDRFQYLRQPNDRWHIERLSP